MTHKRVTEERLREIEEQIVSRRAYGATYSATLFQDCLEEIRALQKVAEAAKDMVIFGDNLRSAILKKALKEAGWME
jgi:hypothetical protein